MKEYDVCKVKHDYQIVNRAKQVILVCKDEGSAMQYVTLLNTAFKNGYKLGNKDGQRGDYCID